MKYMLHGREVTRAEFFGDEAASVRRLEEMFASGKPPAADTDREFLEGTQNQFAGDEATALRLKKVAEAEGQSVTGKRYVGGLARYPGDPRAWVDGKADVRKYLEETGRGCEGALSVKPRDPPKPRVRKTIKPFFQRLREKMGGLPSGVVPPKRRAK
jgi:hypothetical protein